MKPTTVMFAGLLCLTTRHERSNAAPPAEDTACQTVQSPDQQRDEATLRRIGTTHPGSDIIAHAKRNAGKDRDIPPIASTIVIHGDAATAYSRSKTRDKAGEWQDVRFIDSFVFVSGAWHPYTGVDL